MKIKLAGCSGTRDVITYLPMRCLAGFNFDILRWSWNEVCSKSTISVRVAPRTWHNNISCYNFNRTPQRPCGVHNPFHPQTTELEFGKLGSRLTINRIPQTCNTSAWAHNSETLSFEISRYRCYLAHRHRRFLNVSTSLLPYLSSIRRDWNATNRMLEFRVARTSNVETRESKNGSYREKVHANRNLALLKKNSIN